MKPGETGKSLSSRILRAGIAVSIAHALFKLASLWQARVMGQVLSPATYDVVYVFAFENCIFSLFLIGEEILGPALLPVFMTARDEEGEAAAWAFVNVVLTTLLIVLLLAVALLMAFPEVVATTLTTWRPDSQGENYRLAVTSVRQLAPALLGLSLGSLTYTLLNGHKRFFLAAFGNAVWKFTVMGALVLFATPGGSGAATILIAGLVLGSFLKLATHLIGLRDKLHWLRPSLRLANPAFRRMLWLALPLIVGIVFAKIRDVVNNVYILGSIESDGLLQANSMGRKLMNALNWMVPYTLSIAVFPFFCEMVDHSDNKRLGEVVTRVGRQLLAIFIPFAAVVAVLALPLTGLIFGGGQFDQVAVQRTALTTACYTLALPAAAVEAIAMQAFFAHRRMVSVTVVGVLFSSFSMLVSWLGLRLGGGSTWVVLAAIAGGFALSRTLKTLTLIQLLRQSAPVFPLIKTVGFSLRVVAASLLAAAATWGALYLARNPLRGLGVGERLLDLANLALGGGVAAVTLLAAYWLLRIDEPFELGRLALAKVRGRRG